MASAARLLKYEDLMHTEESIKKADRDGIGTAVVGQLKRLYDDVRKWDAVRRFKDDEEAFNWKQDLGPDNHPFQKLYAKFQELLKAVDAGHDVFVFLSGHGNYDGVVIGYPNGKLFKVEHVVEAFFEAGLIRQGTANDWRQKPVTVVLVLNSCNVDDKFTQAKGVSVPALGAATRAYNEAEATTFGDKADWNRRLGHVGVRLAVLRPKRDHVAPMPKLLMPCFMERFIESRSIQKALQQDVLESRMQRYATRYQRNAIRECFPTEVCLYGWELTPVAEKSKADREQEQTYVNKRLWEDALSASGREGDKRKQLFQDIVPTQVVSLDRQTCVAQTRENRQCRRMAQPGGNVCKQHGLLSPPEISMLSNRERLPLNSGIV